MVGGTTGGDADLAIMFSIWMLVNHSSNRLIVLPAIGGEELPSAQIYSSSSYNNGESPNGSRTFGDLAGRERETHTQREREREDAIQEWDNRKDKLRSPPRAPSLSETTFLY